MRILAIHRYFWPDTAPYGVLLRHMAARWAQDGHTVEVLSTQPSYRTAAGHRKLEPVEWVDGVRVRRLSLPRESGRGTPVRLLNLLLWVVLLFVHILRRRGTDVVLVGTTPPVLAAAAARVAARLTGARLLYHCMDIHPELGRISGEFRNPFLYRLLRRMDTRTCKAADRVVVLSTDMQAAITARPGGSGASIAVINNFNVDSAPAPGQQPPPGMPPRSGRLRIIFTGNLGRFQGLLSVVDALLLIERRHDWEMLFIGGGTEQETLKRRAGELLDRQIFFIPYQPLGAVKAAIRDADLGLVSLAPRISRYAYPSKTMTYLGEGCPVLACVEDDSDLARMLREEEIGIVAPPASPQGLADAIRRVADDPGMRTALARRASEKGPSMFDQPRILDRWSKLMAEWSSDEPG